MTKIENKKIKNYNLRYLSLGLHKGQSKEEAFSPQREHPSLQNMKFQKNFLF